MNIVIFAGGAGTRLWPLSRKNSPKQFEVLKDNKSTLQMAVERVQQFGLEHVYVSTNERYADLVAAQIPALSRDHIFTEPAKRDLAAAMGLTLLRLKKQGVSGTVAVLWADHFMEKPDNFVAALKDAEVLIQEDRERIVFLGEKARFANHNLGWICMGKPIRERVYSFVEWRYRPELEVCKKMFESHEWVWNPGYFVFDIDFVLGLYKIHQPEMFDALEKMVEDKTVLMNEYPAVEAISFDKAILEKISPSDAVVLKVDLGWSDPGTLYALKEALTSGEQDNFIKGESVVYNTSDSFVYNEEESKIVSVVGLEGVIVVNTKDSLLVCHKDSVPDITTLLDQLREDGKEQYL